MNRKVFSAVSLTFIFASLFSQVTFAHGEGHDVSVPQPEKVEKLEGTISSSGKWSNFTIQGKAAEGLFNRLNLTGDSRAGEGIWCTKEGDTYTCRMWLDQRGNFHAGNMHDAG